MVVFPLENMCGDTLEKENMSDYFRECAMDRLRECAEKVQRDEVLKPCYICGSRVCVSTEYYDSIGICLICEKGHIYGGKGIMRDYGGMRE